jgi:hypothetical protein
MRIPLNTLNPATLFWCILYVLALFAVLATRIVVLQPNKPLPRHWQALFSVLAARVIACTQDSSRAPAISQSEATVDSDIDAVLSVVNQMK